MENPESSSSQSGPGTTSPDQNQLCAVCKRPIHHAIVPMPDADIPKWVHSENDEFDHPAIKK